MVDIFISYKREEQNWVRLLADAFKAEGFNVWWDPELYAGDLYIEKIEQALRDANCVIVVWSRLSVDSDWVKEEANFAKEHAKLVPIAKEDVRPPFPYGTIHTPSFKDWKGSADDANFKKLVANIKDRIARTEPVEEEKPLKSDKELSDRIHSAELSKIELPAPEAKTEKDSKQVPGRRKLRQWLSTALGVVVAGIFAVFVMVNYIEENRPKKDKIDDLLTQAGALMERTVADDFTNTELLTIHEKLQEPRKRLFRLDPDEFQKEAIDRRFLDWHLQLAKIALERGEKSVAKVNTQLAAAIEPGDERVTEMQKKVAAVHPLDNDPDRQKKIVNLLSQAESAFADGRLTTPEEDSVWTLYGKVLELDPDNAKALEGHDRIIMELVRLAHVARGEDRLTSPFEDNAAYFLQKAADLNPAHRAVNDEKIALYFQLINSVRSLASAGEFERAEQRLKEADRIKPGMEETEMARSDLRNLKADAGYD